VGDKFSLNIHGRNATTTQVYRARMTKIQQCKQCVLLWENMILQLFYFFTDNTNFHSERLL